MSMTAATWTLSSGANTEPAAEVTTKVRTRSEKERAPLLVCIVDNDAAIRWGC